MRILWIFCGAANAVVVALDITHELWGMAVFSTFIGILCLAMASGRLYDL